MEVTEQKAGGKRSQGGGFRTSEQLTTITLTFSGEKDAAEIQVRYSYTSSSAEEQEANAAKRRSSVSSSSLVGFLLNPCRR